MRYAIKAIDGAYLRSVGDSLSSRYDDNGYSCWKLEHAVIFDSLEFVHKYEFHKKGKFSKEEGAVVVGVEFNEVEISQKWPLPIC